MLLFLIFTFCFSSVITKEYAFPKLGSSFLDKIWLLIVKNDSLSPSRNWMTLVFSLSSWIAFTTPQVHFPHIQVIILEFESRLSHNVFNWIIALVKVIQFISQLVQKGTITLVKSFFQIFPSYGCKICVNDCCCNVFLKGIGYPGQPQAIHCFLGFILLAIFVSWPVDLPIHEPKLPARN